MRVDVPLLDPDIILRMFVLTLISVLGAGIFLFNTVEPSSDRCEDTIYKVGGFSHTDVFSV